MNQRPKDPLPAELDVRDATWSFTEEVVQMSNQPASNDNDDEISVNDANANESSASSTWSFKIQASTKCWSL